MKRFNFKGVLDNFRQSVTQPTKPEQPEMIETIKSDHCQLARTARHGFPHQPTALAYDPIQRLVAIGTKSGAIRILGRPGVSVQVRHELAPEPQTAAPTRSANRSSAAADGSAGAEGAERGADRSSASAMTPDRSSNHYGGVGASGGGAGSASGGASSASGTGASGGFSPSAPGAASGSAPSNQAAGFTSSGPAVIQLQFLVNEGALISATSDDTIHLWNIRQKRPEVVHSLKFQRERLVCFHLPFQSKWLYVGTERGNVHVVNIETFTMSGYVINWNKAIELSCKTHPGAVIHLSDCPIDQSKLLMGFESGLIVLWDLRIKAAESRFMGSEPLRSVSWHSEGKQFISAHGDGSLYTWQARTGPRPAPVSVAYPHAKGGQPQQQPTGKPECKSIQKVEWKSTQSGDPFIIFSGGLPQDRPGRSASITVIHGRNTTVLEMEHNVVDFVTLCDTPWATEIQDPHAIIVLLQNDLVIVDLLTPGFPCFENPYPMDIHESAVTCCLYVADCPGDLIPALYSVGATSHSGFSKREWPVSGGQWGSLAPSYAELIVTGHADGTVKFWDTSSLSLQVLYRLKTSKVFEKSRSKRADGADGSGGGLASGELAKPHLAVKQLAMCPDSRMLAVAGASGHAILFKFRRQETSFETTVLDVSLFFESSDELQGSPSFGPGGANLEFCSRKEQRNPLAVRPASYRRGPGFQVDLVCLSPWMDNEAPSAITALSVNSAYGLMAYGNEGGLILVDVVQKSVLLSMPSVELYSSADPYTRLPRSPKRPGEGPSTRFDPDDPSFRSPSDQTEVVEIGSDETTGLMAPEAGDGEKAKDASEAEPDAEPVENETVDAGPDSGDKEEVSASPPSRPHKLSLLNIKRRLSKADSKLRDLFVSGGRRGSGQASGAASSAVSPQDEQPEIAFGDSSSECTPSTTAAPTPTEPEPAKELGSTAKDAGPCAETDGAPPVRPPRRLKKCVSAGAAAAAVATVATSGPTGGQPASRPHPPRLRSSWKRTWQSNDESSTSPPPMPPPQQQPPQVLDLRESDCHSGFLDSIVRKLHKADSAFSRSRSSSASSLENQTAEAVTTLTFADTLARKLDTAVSASLWVGTSQGSILVIVINLPAPGEPRLTQPVMVAPSGSIFRVKGSMVCLAFLEPTGGIISPPYESWRDESKEPRDANRSRTPTRSGLPTPLSGAAGAVGGDALSSDNQYTVMVSEKQARVVSLPSQTCLYRANMTPSDSVFVVTANVIGLKEGPCLASFLSNGHIQVFSLPSLRPLMDVEFTPLIELNFQTSRQNLVDPMLNIWGQQAMIVNEDSSKIARNFRFSAHGHGVYLCSPSEIEKFTISSSFAATLGDLMGELFKPADMPEPPKEGFFKGLFGGGVRPLDREELFGEAATGKPARGIARTIPGPAANLENLNYRAGSVAAEVQKARMALNERGDKLSALEDRTARMANEAENFSSAAHQLMVKYRDRKWYQL